MYIFCFLSVLVNIISVIYDDFSILKILLSFWSFFEEASKVLKIQRDMNQREMNTHVKTK